MTAEDELRAELAEAARAELACGTAWYIPTGQSIADAVLPVVLADRERHARLRAAEELRAAGDGIEARALCAADLWARADVLTLP